jgi:hypothetical protein
MKAFAPPIPVEKVYVLLSDPETPVTPYEFWLEHKPDLLFEKPLIFLIFVVYRPHSSFQGKLEIYVTSCVLEPFNSNGDSRFKKVEIVVLGFSGTQKKKYWSSLNHLQYFLRAHNIFNFFFNKTNWIEKKLLLHRLKNVFWKLIITHTVFSRSEDRSRFTFFAIDAMDLWSFYFMAQPNVLHSSLKFLHFGEPLIFIVYRPHSSFQDIIYFQAKINKQKYSFQKVNIELFSTFEYIQTCSLHSKKVALRRMWSIYNKN